MGKDETYLQVEADDSFGPSLPHLAGVCALVIQDVGKAVVIGSKSVLRFVKIAGAPTVIVNVPDLSQICCLLGMEMSVLLSVITYQ